MTGESRFTSVLHGRTVDLDFETALDRTERALAEQGFGILTRIDVKATLKQKLDIDFGGKYLILGACNPPLAHKALTTVPEVGIMLPCNVVLREVEGGKTRVEVVNAQAMSRMFPEADLAPVADEVARRLDRVLESV